MKIMEDLDDIREISRKLKSRDRNARHENFTKPETIALIDFVKKYKFTILNKATNSEVNHAKNVAWLRISKQYNSLGIGPRRDAVSLKTKFENLKRQLRHRSAKNYRKDSDEIYERVAELVSENVKDIEDCQALDQFTDDEMNETEMTDEYEPDATHNDKSDTDDMNSSRVRSENFSPKETKLLLQCVRPEKQFVFSKEQTSSAIELKNQAWIRIRDSYNKLSPQRRSVKCLRNKFDSVKKIARKLSLRDKGRNLGKHEKLINDTFKDIKDEPAVEESMLVESEQSDHEEADFSARNVETYIVSSAPAPDPLTAVLTADSGIGSTTSQIESCNWNITDDKEVVKLKIDLLNYQMETAKLERKRIEDALVEDLKERESRATERALRLRAARLDAVGAAARLPPAHPALAFPPAEGRAREHLDYHAP